MTEPSEVWRAAGLLLDQRGAEARSVALRRVEELEQQGDFVGAATWRQIAAAVEELSEALAHH